MEGGLLYCPLLKIPAIETGVLIYSGNCICKAGRFTQKLAVASVRRDASLNGYLFFR